MPFPHYNQPQMFTATLYPEIKEPLMSFSEIVALIVSLTDHELATLDDAKFASSLITTQR